MMALDGKDSVMETQPEKHVAQDESGSLDKELVNGDVVDARLPYTAEEEKAVRRKTDMVILPLVRMADSFNRCDANNHL